MRVRDLIKTEEKDVVVAMPKCVLPDGTSHVPWCSFQMPKALWIRITFGMIFLGMRHIPSLQLLLKRVTSVFGDIRMFKLAVHNVIVNNLSLHEDMKDYETSRDQDI